MPSSEYLSAVDRLIWTFGAAAATDADRMDAIGAIADLARRDALDLRVARAGELPAAQVESPTGPRGEMEVEVAAPDTDVVARLQRAGVSRLVIRRGAEARELAQFVGLLVRDAATAGAGTVAGALAAGLDALRIWAVHVEFHGEVQVGGPGAASEDALAPALEAALGALAAAQDAAAVARGYEDVAGAVAVAGATAGAAPGVQSARALARLVDAQQRGERGWPADVVAAHRAGFAALVASELAAVVDVLLAEGVPEAGRVVRRAADGAVPLLLERLGTAESMAERRRCYNAILDTGGGTDALLAALDDPRWFVVRNVAALLGEMREPGAVRPLARALHGADARVSEAAALALDAIGTPSAVHALAGAIRHERVAVRAVAARALRRAPGCGVPVAPEALGDRLRCESSVEVAHALVDALLAFDTPRALGALAAVACEPGVGPLAAEVGAAAWQALLARPARDLLPVLRGLAGGGDPRIAEAAVRVARAAAAAC